MASTKQHSRAGLARTVGLAFAVGALALGYGGTAVQAQSDAPAPEVYTVNAVVGAGDLGTYLTGEDGKTLYYFTKDTAPGASVCEGGCVDNWPLLKLEAGDTLAAGEGVTGVLNTFTRADGTMQATYDGRPLYYFALDAAAGDVNGQGASGVWYVASVDGSVPMAAASPAAGTQVYAVNAVVGAGDLGTYLTGEDGMTLYYFTPDSAPGASVCDPTCLANWPAFLLEADEALAAGDGVTGVLATFPRSDGTMQVAYDGRPLYYFIGDKAAGDVNGQGKSGVWFVAQTDGSVPAS